MLKLSFLYVLPLLLISFGISAQRSVRRVKEKEQKKPDLINVYLKKTIAFRFTRGEYLHFRDSINHQTKDALHKISDHKIEWRPAPEKKAKTDPLAAFLEGADFAIYKDDSLLYYLEPADYRKFKDSIANKTKDTLFVDIWNRVDVHPYQQLIRPDMTTRSSQYVFINPKGYVSIALPLAKTTKYRVVFFDTDNTLLFEINPVKETELILDKTNFMHSGWFSFELYAEGILKEKKRLFLPKD